MLSLMVRRKRYVIALAVIVVAGALGGTYALARALRQSETPGPVGTVGPSEPTPSETAPSASPTPDCEASHVAADFDGDRKPDVAMIDRVACIQNGSGGTDASFAIDVRFGSGAAGSWPMPDCRNSCRAFTTPDLDGDGSAELGVIVRHRASTDYIEFFELPVSEHGPFVLTVASPGAPGYPANKPALFGLGGSETQLDTLRCGATEGPPVLVATGAKTLASENNTVWHAHETVLSVRTPSPGVFVFVIDSTRDYTEPVGPTPSFQSAEDLCGSNLGP
jgi:hypothetical protein